MSLGDAAPAPLERSRLEVCPACGGPPARTALEEPVDYEYAVVPDCGYRFLACGDCASEWLDPRPGEAELVSFYPPGYHAYNDDHGAIASVLVSLRARLRARQYKKLVPEGSGRLFDVGAGDCRHFAELGKAGLSFAGVEINPRMAARAREQGFDVETGTLEKMDLARHRGRYDIVSMNHVLEHVADPTEVLRRTASLLKPGGRLIGQLPTQSSWEHAFFGGTWAGYHYPRHLQLYSREGLSTALEASGFREVALRSAPHVQTALSMQNWLISRGVRAKLEYGRAPFFGLLLLLSLPIEAVAALLNRSGVIDFEARKPR